MSHAPGLRRGWGMGERSVGAPERQRMRRVEREARHAARLGRAALSRRVRCVGVAPPPCRVVTADAGGRTLSRASYGALAVRLSRRSPARSRPAVRLGGLRALQSLFAVPRSRKDSSMFNVLTALPLVISSPPLADGAIYEFELAPGCGRPRPAHNPAPAARRGASFRGMWFRTRTRSAISLGRRSGSPPTASAAAAPRGFGTTRETRACLIHSPATTLL